MMDIDIVAPVYWQRVGTVLSPLAVGDTVSDGTASWVGSSLTGFSSISCATLTATGVASCLKLSTTAGVLPYNVMVGDGVCSGTSDYGYYNIFIGRRAGYNNQRTTGSEGWYNTYIGYYSGYGSGGSNKGLKNVGIGYYTLYDGTTCESNVAIGHNCMANATSGSNNVGLGEGALLTLTTGSYNFALGSNALATLVSGGSNVAIGYSAGRYITGGSNLAIGTSALGIASNTASQNVALGGISLYSITSGENNVGIGYSAGYSCATGSGNVFLGYQAGYNETGSNLLYIANSNTATPLIYGNFSTASLTFNGDVTIADAKNIILNTTTGTKIGTSTSAKLGFYNATPVDQPATVSDAVTQDLTGTDTVDQTKLEADLISCKTAINAVIDRLQELGLIA